MPCRTGFNLNGKTAYDRLARHIIKVKASQVAVIGITGGCSVVRERAMSSAVRVGVHIGRITDRHIR